MRHRRPQPNSKSHALALAVIAVALLSSMLAAACNGQPLAKRNPSASSIYRTLLQAPVEPGLLLPGGVRVERGVAAGVPTADHRHHGIGSIDVLTNKVGIGLTYSVFPMRSDAVADFADLPGTISAAVGSERITGRAVPADLPQPAKLIIGIAKESGLGGSSFTSNVAFLAFVDGIVGVRVVVVTERRAGGEAYNRGVATALARAADQRLRIALGTKN